MTAACSRLVALAVALVIASPLAHADQRAQADAAFKRGREAFKAEKWQEACEAFEESQALDPQLGTKFNLAQCLEKVGKLATALGMYKELLAVDDNAVRKGLTNDAMTALGPRVPKIQVVVDKPPADLVVSIQDAKGVGRPVDISQPVLVDVGTYKVIASGKGVKDWSSPMTTTSEGQTTQVVVVFTPGQSGGSGGSEYSIWHPKSRGRLRAVGIIAAGGALVVTSLYFGYKAYSYQSDAENVCGGDNKCATPGDLEKANDLRDKGQTRGTVSTVLFVGGVAAIGTGTIMYFLAKHSGSSEPTVRAQLTTESIGVSYAGSF